MKKRLFALGLIAFTLFSGSILRAATVTVFAAASLTDSLKEIATKYEKETGNKMVLNFGASSLLARQIAEGAPADIFFSADELKMNALEKKGLILADTRKSRLSNTLVVVISADSVLKIASIEDLATPIVKHIALADPKAVPAGIYSKTYLEKVKLWSALERKIVPTENVRAALAAVESGNVEVGMVYKTDAGISKKVKVAYEISTKDGPSISYPMAVIKESKVVPAAKQFLDYLNSDEATGAFKRFGFIILK